MEILLTILLFFGMLCIASIILMVVILTFPKNLDEEPTIIEDNKEEELN